MVKTGKLWAVVITVDDPAGNDRREEYETEAPSRDAAIAQAGMAWDAEHGDPAYGSRVRAEAES